MRTHSTTGPHNRAPAPLDNSCKWCGNALRAGADLHDACRAEYLASPMRARELDRAAEVRNENAATDRAEAVLDARPLLGGDEPADASDLHWRTFAAEVA